MIDRAAVGLDCPACSHRPHGADNRRGIDVRCGEIIDSSGGPMPEPEHCSCLDYGEVYKAHQRLIREAKHEATGQYAGMVAVLRGARESGLIVHVATRSTCAEHLEHGDDKATEMVRTASPGLDMALLAQDELAAAGCFIADHGADPAPCRSHVEWAEAMLLAIRARRDYAAHPAATSEPTDG